METATITRPTPGSSRFARLRALGVEGWARAGFALLGLAVLVGFFAFPTYPNYDSYYSLLWGRELVHGVTPSFEAYRAPTEHPLAIFVGVLLQPFGRDADRVLVFLTFVALLLLVWGVYRLAKDAFTPLVGVVAAVILITRFDFGFLAARGYIDIPYLALVVWAAVLETEKPRRGGIVWVLLAAAAMTRAEAWILAGAYFLWMSWRATWPRRLRYAVFAGIGPAVWVATDYLVTGDPLFSLNSTSGLAEELGRDQGVGEGLANLPFFLNKTLSTPVTAAALAGIVAALWCAPRRSLMPLFLVLSGVGTFLLVGLAGLSVIARYLAITEVALIVFGGVAIAGWTMLRPGTRWRTAWIAVGALIVLGGIAFSIVNIKPKKLVTDLSFRGNAHADLVRVLDSRVVRRDLRCGPVSTPNHRTIPDIRWILDLPERGVVSRGDPTRSARTTRGVGIYISGRQALSRQVWIAGGDDPLLQVPGWRKTAANRFAYTPGFTRSRPGVFYTAYVRCPAG